MRNYGHFSDNGKEYIITAKNLPRKWDQYLWNDKFMCRVNNDATGVSFYKHKDGMRTGLVKEKRIVYIRDNDSKIYFSSCDCNTVKYGIGYVTFEKESNDLSLHFRISVPQHANAEAWKITVKNNSDSNKNISIFTCMPPDLTGYFTPFMVQCYKTYYNRQLNALTFVNADAYCPTTHFNAYFCADRQIDAFDCVGEIFLGKNRDYNNPEAVIKGECSNMYYWGGGGDFAVSDLMAALQFNVYLKPGEEKSLHVLCGIYEIDEEIQQVVEKYIHNNGVDKELEEYIINFDNMVNGFKIKTPDDTLNRLFNIWAKYNLSLTSQWTRIYSRGFRDVLQDTMAVASIDKEIAKKNILVALSHEYKSGRCKRAWDNIANALSDEFYSDGPVWIPAAINEYIKETGDVDILYEVCDYLDGGSGTVLEHMLIALEFLFNDKGKHGLCLIHYGDWLDSAHLIGQKGIGEGVWLSIALYNAIKEAIELLDFIGEFDIKKKFEDMAQSIKKAVNESGWDGQWFLQAYNDYGEKVGSSENDEGNVYLNAQSWAVFSGITTPEREAMCFNVIDNVLDSPIGTVLFDPPYTSENHGIGTTSGFAPGTIGNASGYCHATSFKLVADCARGRGNIAYDTLKKIMPGGSFDESFDEADCPPYAFTNARFAVNHQYLGGRCGGTWNTATVAWCWYVVSELMLGVRKTFRGLCINPCLPEKWHQVEVQRHYRGSTYNILIENPNHVQTGVKKIFVNGKEYDDAYLPNVKGVHYNVKVVMG